MCEVVGSSDLTFPEGPAATSRNGGQVGQVAKYLRVLGAWVGRTARYRKSLPATPCGFGGLARIVQWTMTRRHSSAGVRVSGLQPSGGRAGNRPASRGPVGFGGGAALAVDRSRFSGSPVFSASAASPSPTNQQGADRRTCNS